MANKGKTVLIVYAHHNEKSLNAAILDTTVKALEDDGCDVIISDLYVQKFNPKISPLDLKVDDGQVADDIAAEQTKLSKADLVIFQFPMMWFSVPAVLKGWFDRILTSGYAYNKSSLRLYDNGLLKGKKAVLSFTTSSSAAMYSPEGLNGDMNMILYPVHRGTLQFCGFEVLPHHMINGTDNLTKEAAQNCMQAWKQRIPKLWSEECLLSLPLEQFDFSKGGILSEDSVYRTMDCAPTVGTHCGKPIV